MTTLSFACSPSFVPHSLQSSSCARQRRHWLRHRVSRDTQQLRACTSENPAQDVVIATTPELVHSDEPTRHPSTHLDSVLEACELGEQEETLSDNHSVSLPTSRSSVTRDIDVVVTHSR